MILFPKMKLLFSKARKLANNNSNINNINAYKRDNLIYNILFSFVNITCPNTKKKNIKRKY